MPLPPQLSKKAPKAKKKKAMGETMKDLKEGPHHKDRTHKQEVAIGLKQSGQSKKEKPSPEAKMRKMSNRKKRNKGRH